MKVKDAVKIFIKDDEIPWQEIDKGVKRKIMAYDDKLMMAKVKFETGGVGALHHHHHSQISYVESGTFEIEIDKEKTILKTGDVYYVPPNAVHGAVCLQEGILIDVFSPMRNDFI